MSNKIVNIKNKPTPYFDVYIGRKNEHLGLEQSKWHNPFKMSAEYQRYGVLEKYYEYIIKQDKLLSELRELDGKILGCYCAPRFCHGHILFYLRSKQKEGWHWEDKFINEVRDSFLHHL